MKKGKILKVSTFIMTLVLMVILSGCGANKLVDAEVSGIGNSESENQDADSPSVDSTIPLEGASDGQIERVDNPDGGWTMFEYGETGEKVRESIYDADGKQIEDVVYNGSIKKSTTEYSYDEAGEQDKSVVYDYNANGSIWKVAEYDRIGNRTKALEYTYNADGSIKRTTEHDYGEGGQSKRVDYGYDDDGILAFTSEYVAGWQVKYTAYNTDGTVDYYSTDYEYNGAGICVKYISYSADGILLSETEFNDEGQEVKYTFYNYTYYNNDTQVVGYTTEEYDGDGKMVDTEYIELDPDTGQLVDADLEQQKETEHFVFYCIEQDIEVLGALAEALEGCYDRITSDLGKIPADKTIVYISEC